MDPLTVARLWMLIKPVKRLRNRRRAKRGLPPLSDQEVAMPDVSKVILSDGTETIRTEPLIKARTTTKQAVVGAAAILPIVQGLQEVEFPWPWLNQMLDNDAIVQIITIAALVVWGRFFKSPSDGGVL